MNNFISVIITIYDRKEFYRDAIKSAINQTIGKEFYEILVVHNIDLDEKYDGIKYIKCQESSLGSKILIGLENARGNIISFLEDDDIFLPSKLQFVYDVFKNEKVGYLHNDYISNVKYFRNKGHSFNMSCISIKRDIINRNIGTVTIDSDIFMYYSALESGQKLVISNNKLTFYRVHDTNISSNMNKINDFRMNEIKQLLTYYQKIDNRKTRIYIKSHISLLSLHLLLDDYDFKNNKIEFYLYSYLFFPFGFHKLLTYVVYVLYRHNIFKKQIRNILQARKLPKLP